MLDEAIGLRDEAAAARAAAEQDRQRT